MGRKAGVGAPTHPRPTGHRDWRLRPPPKRDVLDVELGEANAVVQLTAGTPGGAETPGRCAVSAVMLRSFGAVLHVIKTTVCHCDLGNL